MSREIYWGKEGQYGPFDSQKDGWPNAGQVMRTFREKAGITAKALGKLYGKEIREDGKPICERWILEMELENKVPSDITRRRIIACLLHIPPALIGLASFEDVSLEGCMTLPLSSSESTFVERDISLCERNIHLALHLHVTSSAKIWLDNIETDKGILEHLAKQTSGKLLYRIKELLVANNLLAAKILRDQRRYHVAYIYTNHALIVAKSSEDDELVATSLYTRGCIKLQWGQFGSIEQGRFQIDKNKIKNAMHDFQNVLNIEASCHISLHPQLRGFVLLQLSRAQSLLQAGRAGRESTNALALADQAENVVECTMIDDLYTRMIVTGTLSGLHLGGYYLTRADIFNIAGLPEKAITEMDHLHHLTEQTYGKDEIRSQGWQNIVQARALMGLKEYPEATKKVREALISCHFIESLQNVAIIANTYNELKSSSYGNSGDVKELGKMLEEWYRHSSILPGFF